LHDALGAELEDPGAAYGWAKRGVKRFVKTEAVRLGPAGARICSVSPGIIDTPQGRQEAEVHPIMEELVERTPLGREGRPEALAGITLTGVMCITALTGTAGARTLKTQGVTDTSVKIGFISSSTGVAAPNYKGAAKACEARVDAQNAKGGVNGRKIDLITVDD